MRKKVTRREQSYERNKETTAAATTEADARVGDKAGALYTRAQVVQFCADKV